MASSSASLSRQLSLTIASAVSCQRTQSAFSTNRPRVDFPVLYRWSSCCLSTSAVRRVAGERAQGESGSFSKNTDAPERTRETRADGDSSSQGVNLSGGTADSRFACVGGRCTGQKQAESCRHTCFSQDGRPNSGAGAFRRSGEGGSASPTSSKNPALRGSVTPMHRAYRFDRILDSTEADPQTVAYLDRLAMTGLKTLEVPQDVKTKLEVLLKQVSQKRDLENMGRFIMAKLTARTSVELPRVLPSRLLHNPHGDDMSPDPRDEAEHGTDTEGGKADDYEAAAAHSDQEALAFAEDRRHRLFRKFMGSHSPVSAAAYTAHRYAAVYASLVRILSEIKLRAPDFKPRRVMELQAGFAAGLMATYQIWGSSLGDLPAAAALAASHTSSECGSSEGKSAAAGEPRASGDTASGFEYLLAVERSVHLANVGKYLTAEFVPKVNWQLGLYEEGTEESSGVETSGADKASTSGQRRRLDLVIMPHCLLSSVDGQESRHMLVRNVWNRLSHGGVLVLAERGTPTGFRAIHAVRELFIKELGVGKFHFLAPCPHESICPLALTGRDWCHFAQRVRRLPHHLYCKGSRAKNVEEDKFSFLVVRKMEGPRRKYVSEGECASLEEQSHFWPRVVMPVVKAGQHCLLDVCARPHTFERVAVSKSMPHGAGYKFARKAAWGDLWRFPRRVIRPEARGYTSEEMQQHLLRLAAKNRAKEARGREGSEQVGSREERERLEDEFVRFFGN
ncbi:mitochondrial small ribosomal subunit rsm22 protein [Toxoplasma gondii p89]|uniref:Mitochondrial small ribosomal subunit rsm22 protein n=1 Tax=Toxoplasma gondii p89 TaxID=943119 RepID=A0A086K997_TOXGO|nr:mitochondrial small ribosomal subunit rsm22 protein [Toxoplasma gondii p89]